MWRARQRGCERSCARSWGRKPPTLKIRSMMSTRSKTTVTSDFPDDDQADEAAAEQTVLLMSLEMKHRDEAARQFMVAKRRAAADRLVASQAAIRLVAHRRNMEAARVKQRLEDQDRRVAMAAVAEAR
jgi:hypothetical protein